MQEIYQLGVRQTSRAAGLDCGVGRAGGRAPLLDLDSAASHSWRWRCPERGGKEALHVVADSTGMKGFGEGEWKVRQHGYTYRRTWRKVHLGVDEASGEIVQRW